MKNVSVMKAEQVLPIGLVA